MSELEEVLNTPEPGCHRTDENNCKLLTPSILTERMLQQLQCSLGVASQYATNLEVADLSTEGDAEMKKMAEEHAIDVMKELQHLLSESLQVEQIKLQIWMIKNAKKVSVAATAGGTSVTSTAQSDAAEKLHVEDASGSSVPQDGDD